MLDVNQCCNYDEELCLIPMSGVPGYLVVCWKIASDSQDTVGY